jgi:hypothetical protein
MFCTIVRVLSAIFSFQFAIKKKKVLTLVLKSFESELRGEIGKTENREFKADLNGEEDVIRDLIKKVAQQKTGKHTSGS